MNTTFRFFIKSLAILLALSFFAACNKDDEGHIKPKPDMEFEEPELNGNTFYIDPINGSALGDGSKENPWRTLQEVIADGKIEYYQYSENYNTDSPLEIVHEGAPVKGGDRLILRNGYHGNLNLNRFIFKEWLTISADEGHKPVFSQIKLVGAFAKIYFKGLTVIKSSYQGEGNYWEAEDITHNTDACLHLQSSSFWGKGSDVKVSGLTLMTTENTEGWTAEDWTQRHATGISLRSVENVEIVNCHIENVRHGVAIEYFSDHSVFMNNTIKRFSGDGARIISNHVFFGYNTISDCMKVDDNHDDCIQSYSRGEENRPGTGVISDIVVRGNILIGTTEFDHPLAGSPQGIGCFDGMFDNWIVENNLVISNTYHGIAFYGMTNSKIANNTVIDLIPNDDVSPWIRITEHKSGFSSYNCVVLNNIVSSSVSISGENVLENNNYVLGKSNYDEVYDIFVNPDALDFHLLDNAFTREHIIDQGMHTKELMSSEIDIDYQTRDEVPDLGAYEL